METLSHKITYYEDENFFLKLQPEGGTLFMHCEVLNWKPSVLKKMYEVFNTLQNEAKENGYEKLATISPNPKFAKLFGGKTVMKNYMGMNLEVILWDLN